MIDPIASYMNNARISESDKTAISKEHGTANRLTEEHGKIMYDFFWGQKETPKPIFDLRTTGKEHT